MEKSTKKYLAIHAHFYQPPRENPWTGQITPQDSAYPYNDWNERIARECYMPNAYARIHDNQGRIVEMVNNYEYFNFNFGPTLLAWYEKRYPYYYKTIIETAAKTKALYGRSNAIAQAYNHTILPLSTPADRLTQIRWGLKDFEIRFGFKAEAMWLPETAANPDTLSALIDHGMRYVILSPYQAERIRPLDSQHWTDSSHGHFNTRRPYLWQERDINGNRIPGRSLAIFFYDGHISKAVAFDGLLKNSEHFSSRVAESFSNNEQANQLLCLAVDGETFGHHHKFADMTLAHSFKYELKKHNIETTNLSAYLDNYEPQWEAEIKQGHDGEGTAWSCAHGLRRWKGGCDCGQEERTQTNWRMPLRSAFNWLRDATAEIYSHETAGLLTKPEEALFDYAELFTGSGFEKAESFLKAHAPKDLSPEEKTKILKLLELQKDLNFMFTSCGWFFSELSRLEPVQNLKYAAKAISALEKLGFTSLEKRFTEILELAPSNYPHLENGRKIYETMAKTQQPDKNSAAALFLFDKFLFKTQPAQGVKKLSLIVSETAIDGEFETVTGELEITHPASLETESKAFFYFRQGHRLPVIWFSETGNLPALRRVSEQRDFRTIAETLKTIGATEFTFATLAQEDKTRTAETLSHTVTARHLDHLENIAKDYLALLNENNDYAEFSVIKTELNKLSAAILKESFESLLLTDENIFLEKITTFTEALKRHRVFVRFDPPPAAAAECVLRALKQAGEAPSQEKLEQLLKLLGTTRYLALSDAFFHLQNGLYDLFKKVKTEPQKWSGLGSILSELHAHSDIND